MGGNQRPPIYFVHPIFIGWTGITFFCTLTILSTLFIETLGEQCETRVLEDIPPDPVR